MYLLKFGSSPSCIKVQNIEYISHCCSRVIWQTRSSPVTHDQHAPVLSLALQGDVTSLSVSQQTSLSSYLPHQSTDLIQSYLQRQKAFEPFRDDLFGGSSKKLLFAIKWWMRAFAGKNAFIFERQVGVSRKTWRIFDRILYISGCCELYMFNTPFCIMVFTVILILWKISKVSGKKNIFD